MNTSSAEKKNSLQASANKISLTIPFWVMYLTREKKMTAGETAQRRDLEAPEFLPPSHTDSSHEQKELCFGSGSLITEAQTGREGA